MNTLLNLTLLGGAILVISACQEKGKNYWTDTKDGSVKRTSEEGIQPDPRLAEFNHELLKASKQVAVCDIPMEFSDDFREFVRSKGIQTYSQGGEESMNWITVYEGDRERFFAIAGTPEVVARFGLKLVRDQSKSEQ